MVDREMIQIASFKMADRPAFQVIAEINDGIFREAVPHRVMAMVVDRIADVLADRFIAKYGDEIVAKLDKDRIKNQILLAEQMKDLKKFQEAMISGRCVGCGKKTRDWKAPSGSFAPEQWASLEEKGIDPKSGHLKDCEFNK